MCATKNVYKVVVSIFIKNTKSLTSYTDYELAEFNVFANVEVSLLSKFLHIKISDPSSPFPYQNYIKKLYFYESGYHMIKCDSKYEKRVLFNIMKLMYSDTKSNC